MASCMECKKLKNEGGGLWYCDYECTFYMNSVIEDRTDYKCPGFEQGDGIENRWNLSSREIRRITKRNKMSKIQNSINQNRTSVINCKGCGKPSEIKLTECYCEECKEIENAKDQEKIKLFIEDPKNVHMLVQGILEEAVRDYKTILGQIMADPLDVMLYRKKYEVEDYFYSGDFKHHVEYVLDMDEIPHEMFERKVETLLNTIKKGVDFDEDKYPSPARGLFDL